MLVSRGQSYSCCDLRDGKGQLSVFTGERSVGNEVYSASASRDGWSCVGQVCVLG